MASDRDDAADAARLVEEDAEKSPQNGPISQAALRQRRAHRYRLRAEQDQPAVLQDQRDAERQDELRVVALALGRDRASAGDTRDQEAMDQVAEDEQDGAGEQRRRQRRRVGPEKAGTPKPVNR